MKFKYNKQEFIGTYSEIRRALTEHLKNSELWLIDGEFNLCGEKYKVATNNVGINRIKSFLVIQALAKIPTSEEYFDSNAEILFIDGIVQIVVDKSVVGSADDYMFYKQLQELRENWISQNA